MARPHLEQAKPVIAAHKPLFIDKPLAATLEDAREIARLAKAAGVPWFSSSSLRFGDHRDEPEIPGRTGVTTWGPGPIEAHHQLELAWYAIHPDRTAVHADGNRAASGHPHLRARTPT